MNRYPISLVIDQGSHISGYALVEHRPNVEVSFGVFGKLHQHGIITLPNKLPLAGRLQVWETDIQQLIDAFQPDELVMENTLNFRQKSADANLAMSALLYKADEICLKNKLKKYLTYPQKVKQALTGNGNASKQDVQKAAIQLWGNPRIYDENHSDALAIAFWWLSFRNEYVK